jgi:hypothetical protein
VTWKNWRDGIRQNLDRPAFRQAWVRLVPDLNGTFQDLRKKFPEYLPALGAVVGGSKAQEILEEQSDRNFGTLA